MENAVTAVKRFEKLNTRDKETKGHFIVTATIQEPDKFKGEKIKISLMLPLDPKIPPMIHSAGIIGKRTDPKNIPDIIKVGEAIIFSFGEPTKEGHISEGIMIVSVDEIKENL